jgi:hypothetical protein
MVSETDQPPFVSVALVLDAASEFANRLSRKETLRHRISDGSRQY